MIKCLCSNLPAIDENSHYRRLRRAQRVDGPINVLTVEQPKLPIVSIKAPILTIFFISLTVNIRVSLSESLSKCVSLIFLLSYLHNSSNSKCFLVKTMFFSLLLVYKIYLVRGAICNLIMHLFKTNRFLFSFNFSIFQHIETKLKNMHTLKSL